jgi:hypothetical protein
MASTGTSRCAGPHSGELDVDITQRGREGDMAGWQETGGREGPHGRWEMTALLHAGRLCR